MNLTDKPSGNYISELLHSAEAIIATASDPEETLRSLPAIIGAIRNLTAVVTILRDDLRELETSIIADRELTDSPTISNNDSPTSADEPSTTEQEF